MLFWTNPGSKTPTKQQLYGHLPPISKTIQVRSTGHYLRSKEELISNTLLWTPTHGYTSVGHPAKISTYQLCVDTRCSLEDLPGGIDDRDG